MKAKNESRCVGCRLSFLCCVLHDRAMHSAPKMGEKTGLIHVYCGDGKGKTTAAIGLAVRAAGCGLKVAFVQFLKGQQSGELASFEKLANITVIREKLSPKFSFQMNDKEKHETSLVHEQYIKKALELVQDGSCDMLILDEAMGALSCGLLDEELLKHLVCEKPEQLELILTGRNPPQWLLDKADYVSEIKKIKHPYDAGISARNGIER